MKTKRGQLLINLVDPYAYREKLTMPKLIILGTNDPVLDGRCLQPLLSRPVRGTKHLFYLANAGHGLGAQIAPTMAHFFKKSLDGETLSAMKWEVSPGRKIPCQVARRRGQGQALEGDQQDTRLPGKQVDQSTTGGNQCRGHRRAGTGPGLGRLLHRGPVSGATRD